mgnify:CR=1 FL=1
MSMLKLESFFFFSFFLFLAGCGNQSKPVSVEQEIITPLSAGNAVNDLLPYIDSVEVVPLETTGKALIGLVGKILLLPNGNVLIKSTASMFMFSPEGKFLFQIGKNGRGPEEYLTIDDVCLSQDARELWILGGCEIVKYSTETGRFIRKTTLELPEICNGFDAIASGPGHSAFLYYCPQMDENNFSEDFYCLYRYDEQGRILQKFLPRKDYGLNIALITQASDNRYILRPQDSDNICYYLSVLVKAGDHLKSGVSSAIGYASVLAAANLNARCIITPSVSGATTRVVSNLRPRQEILGITPNERTLRRMSIYWGVRGLKSLEFHTTDDICSGAIDLAQAKKCVDSGDIVVLTAGIPSPSVQREKGSVSNMMRIATID